MSNRSTAPESASALAEAIMRSTLPPLGGSSSTESTRSPRRSFAWSSVSVSGDRAGDGSSGSTRPIETAGARRSETASRMAATCTGVVPQQPPTTIAPSAIACEANSPKYSGVALG